uniref:2-oxoglutarate-dependent dioxygenase, putative n=2 Tax=Oryza sativa subsp. japonica TaxID=39947 RepID=Q53LS3_ORYSJ|nr:Similar to probable oxidoreductase, 38288-39393 [imported] - Arabidopsis thaliana [Oryza sativa Japonica Group]AAX96321.1 Similar to probable oxidoreductase, 38288-39393 [imported] - Arabidopsis thaliana [Oryza sativa Japonica Group]ABA92578.1 2-oxoglutarate-dependent dioxygenase, putative [Oryza sativa Japonica Group]
MAALPPHAPLPSFVGVSDSPALTNGQVYNPLHRVVVSGDEARYSAILFSLPVDGAAVRPLDEAVDGDHPAMYRPFDYGEYAVFCYLPENMTPEVMKHAHKLEAFAAVRTTTTASASASAP